ncbi:uncharacterized protein METZ01_LOCUS261758, partial [marine metagenome]
MPFQQPLGYGAPAQNTPGLGCDSRLNQSVWTVPPTMLVSYHRIDPPVDGI